ncbi:MAG: SDR family NAD(P)-dependent oxidoreductase [Rhodospirillaceae bacterium]|nr:SDR family NAD(P)-dependent oxidoreductase [Rhodospirillaceae bacterium]
MTIRFDGRVAIVTGAGAGLGRSHALALAARGAKVVVNDLGADLHGSGTTGRAADAVVAEIEAAGGVAVPSYDSVAEPDAAARIVKTALDAFGTVDILVNNAGILRDKSFEKMELADFDLVLKVHLQGSVYVTKAAWPVMREKGYGRIVVTTSAAGLYGSFGQTNYAAAKSGLVGFMLALKEEGAKYNVLANAIAPVAFTRMLATVVPDQLRQRLRPEVATAGVLYLSSEQCTATGCVLEAGDDRFALARLVKTHGVKLAPGAAVTPEAVAEHWAEIADLAGATPHVNAQSAVGESFKIDA